ncbi:hypothetical protein CLAIMM_03785 [Cladophialophora immunda]|nr:hypothetical protein CLAIMM_03785 [Cladophialophora immunda]
MVDGKVYLENDAGLKFRGKVNHPDGKRAAPTSWELQSKAPLGTKSGTGTSTTTVHSILPKGKSFVVTMIGTLNKKWSTVMQLKETRLGAWSVA